ncbi:MAG: ribonuclease domain-containing protein [Psychrobacter celer]
MASNDLKDDALMQSGKQNNNSPRATLFGVLALIVAAIYFFADINADINTGALVDHTEGAAVAEYRDSAEPDPSIDSAALSRPANSASPITGDAQIDHTIALIRQGGPFPYPHKDGSTFYNREGRLPIQTQGYYREYTVPTPGVSHRGARRIVTGGHPPTIYYLTVDHYDSFHKLEVK